MGLSVSSLLLCRWPAQLRILMLGLAAAGKTSLLYRLKLGGLFIIPSIGFNVETLRFDDRATLTVWDFGGRCKTRPLYEHHIDGSQGVIYVIDSTDRDRLSESFGEIKRVAELLTSHQMPNVPLVVLCNKCDSANSAVTETQAAVQNLIETCPDLSGRQHNCFAVSAVTGDGLTEAVGWLVDAALNKDAAFKQVETAEAVTKTALETGWGGLYRVMKSVALL